ncbi:MAG TPA: hypothetical protein VK633_03085, partial [Verrucomicrobiae bacterium]|nr:hypothetical protein [Verrucomicrobiae bacterium]
MGNGRLAALATALVIILVSYPGVLFFGHSIQASHIIEEFSINPGQVDAKPYWEPSGRRPNEGYHDLGGAAWFMEPMAMFMRNCIRSGESPYWNPYSACGSLGPETLMDAKFSLFTLAVALAGASSLSFHLILFATHLIALYCLYRLLAGPFALGRCASFVGCAVFYLGGARLAFASSQVSLPLIMAPVLLYPLVAFMQNPRWSWFVLSIAGSAAVQLTQFVPGIIVVHLVACALLVGFFLELERHWSRSVWIRLALAFSTFPLGVLLCAPLWFPFVASLAQTTLSSEYYGRMTSHVPAAALFSLFSPQHLWESYSGFSRSGGMVIFPKGGSLASSVFHWGIVTTVLAATAFGAKNLRRRPLFWTLAILFLFVHCMEWRWPFISPLAELPVLRSIRYWYLGSLILVALLAALGLENLNRRNCTSAPAIGGFVLLAGTFFLAWRIVGGIPPGRGVECILVLAVTSLCALFLLAGRLAERSLPWIQVFFPVLLLAELVNYANHLQPPRN